MNKLTKAKDIIAAIEVIAEESEMEVVLLGSKKTRAGLAPAIVGIIYANVPKVVYHYDKLISCLMDINHWNEDEATDWYDYNIAGTLNGAEDEPVIMHDLYY